jgi:hypothetical protein
LVIQAEHQRQTRPFSRAILNIAAEWRLLLGNNMQASQYKDRTSILRLIRNKSDNSVVGIWNETDGEELNLAALITAQAALTEQLATITHTDPETPDYAIQDLTDTGGFGFATLDEGLSVLKVIANLQTRCAELEARLVTTGILP